MSSRQHSRPEHLIPIAPTTAAIAAHAAAPKRRTVADLMRLVRCDEKLTDRRRKDDLSALTRFCDLLRRHPADVSIDSRPLRESLQMLHRAQSAKKHWKHQSIRPKTLNNIKARVRTIVGRSANALRIPKAPQSQNWQAAFSKLPIHPHPEAYRRYVLSRFSRFASAIGVDPENVTDDFAERYRDALFTDPFIKNRPLQYRRTLLAWNWAAEHIQGWPKQRLSIARKREGYCLPMTEAPVLFLRDCDAYFDHITGRTRRPGIRRRRKIRLSSEETYRFQVQQAFSILHHKGSDVKTFTGLKDLVMPERALPVLEFFLDRNDGKPGSQSSNMLRLLLSIAKHWCRSDDRTIDELISYIPDVGYKQVGLTEKNRALLRQFDSERNLAWVLHLPGILWRKATSGPKPSKEDALLAQSAVLIELLLMTALRRRNIAKLRLDTHIAMHRDYQREQVFIVLSEPELKNEEPAEFRLRPESAKLLVDYITIFRPLLSSDPNGWLFPGSKPGTHKCLDQISRQAKKVVLDRTGLRVTAHLFRHIAAKIYLGKHPEGFEVVRRFLLHRKIETTVNNYIGFGGASAARAVDDLIFELREHLPVPEDTND